MAHRTFKSVLAAAAVLGSLAVAPSAHALDRNTGVGHEIAAQGNQAILLIRAEFKAAAQKLFQPALPKPRARKTALQTGPADAAPSGSATGQTFVESTPARCAE
jgi:hypothetical protein